MIIDCLPVIVSNTFRKNQNYGVKEARKKTLVPPQFTDCYYEYFHFGRCKFDIKRDVMGSVESYAVLILSEISPHNAFRRNEKQCKLCSETLRIFPLIPLPLLILESGCSAFHVRASLTYHHQLIYSTSLHTCRAGLVVINLFIVAAGREPPRSAGGQSHCLPCYSESEREGYCEDGIVHCVLLALWCVSLLSFYLCLGSGRESSMK